MAKVLFLNHGHAQCGVWNCGDRIAQALLKYSEHQYVYELINYSEDFWKYLKQHEPDITIVNYHPHTQPWLNTPTEEKLKADKTKMLGICHEENTLSLALALCGRVVLLDPTFNADQEYIFTTCEGIPESLPTTPEPEIPTIGSLGFGFANKGWNRIVEAVNEEFDEAVIRFHMPIATFGDPQGGERQQRVQQAEALIKPGIRFEPSFDYLDEQGLVNWAAGNSLNCFLYDEVGGRGPSGAIYWALAARRPICITNTGMMRLINKPEIRIEENTLKEIITRGTKPLEEFYTKWSMPNIVKDYDRFVDKLNTIPNDQYYT